MLPPFGKKLGAKTKTALEELGVEVQLGAMVSDVDERGLVVQDKDGTHRRIEAVTKIWAAGVQASPLGQTLAEQSGATLDRAGRIGVNPDLTLPGYPEVFVVGDMIALNNLPGVAQVAIQGAKYAAKEIKGRLNGKPPQRPFKYFDKGNLATISRFDAVAAIGKVRLSGFIAWLIWLGVHLIYLTGFKNQVTALLHWTVTFLSNDRSQRTATEQQIFARTALEAAAAAVRPGWSASRGTSTTVVPSSRRSPRRRPGSPTPGNAAGWPTRPVERPLEPGLLEPGWLAVVAFQGLACPARQDEDALGADGRLPVGVAHLALDDGLHALDPVDPAPRPRRRRAGCSSRSAGSACRSCPASRRRPRPRRGSGRARARRRRRAPCRVVPRRAR